VTKTSSFTLARSNVPVWAHSTRVREYLSTSLQTVKPASHLPTICSLPNSPRKESHVALTTDVLAEMMVWVPPSTVRCAGLSFLIICGRAAKFIDDRPESEPRLSRIVV
jgi:hypothetical protein